MNVKKMLNIVFYAVLIGVTIYMLNRKFIVPKIDAEDLVFLQYNNEESVQLADYQDKIVVINFWQTWCGPCLHEMPSLNEMSGIWDGLQVICVSNESFSKVHGYIEKYSNIDFVTVENFNRFGVTQFPTTYIYNSEGAKVYSKIGSKNWSDPNFIATLKKNWSR
ncbi:TlpA family protein disulfide reductase [Chitinophagales bacterium]|jgi:thiol-disulfide isomerase/thioredoxin|nr:TlpA family protein disulfide reductase [Chitinophagales bacterium]|tara:strand:- start:8964 stop:9455 length:492 start_codon:yes stop_codon:yes gene_type:complete